MKRKFLVMKRDTIWYYKLANEKTYHSTGQRTRAKAENWVSEEILDQKKKPLSNLTVKEYFELALTDYAKDREEAGSPLYNGYIKDTKSIIDRFILIDQKLSNMRLDEVRQFHIKEFQNRLLSRLKKEFEEGKINYSRRNTAHRVMKVVKQVFRRSYKLGYIDRNPADGLLEIKVEKKERDIFLKEELDKLFPENVWETNKFDPWEDEYDYSAFLLAASTGMRRGEVLALRWSSLNLENDVKTVEVKEALKRNEIGLPKSKKSRFIPICDRFLWEDERAITALKMLRQRFIDNQKKYRQDKGVMNLDGPVFGYVDGSLRKQTWWKKRFDEALTKAGINRDRGPKKLPLDPHSLRHNLASVLKSYGIPDSLIREIFGWTAISVQTNYTHMNPEVLQRIINFAKQGSR